MISRRDFLRNTAFAAPAMAKRSPKLLETINRTMKESCWLIFKGLTDCEVVCSKLGDKAGVLDAIRKVHKVPEK